MQENDQTSLLEKHTAAIKTFPNKDALYVRSPGDCAQSFFLGVTPHNIQLQWPVH